MHSRPKKILDSFLLIIFLCGIQMDALGSQGTWPTCSFSSCSTNNLVVSQAVIAGPNSPTQSISITSDAYLWAQITVPAGNKIRKDFYFIGNLLRKDFGQANFQIVQSNVHDCMVASVNNALQCWITADTGTYWFRSKSKIDGFPWGAQEVKLDPLTIAWQTGSGQSATSCNCPAACTEYPDGQCWSSFIMVTLSNPSSLGDFVWHDLNANGIQNTGEPGISGITVNLFKSGDTSSLATATTNANGEYHFLNLPAGSYFVEFVKPSGYIFAPADQGTDDLKDSDANIITGRTSAISLASGSTDYSWDAGMYKMGLINLIKTSNPKDPQNFIFTTNISGYQSITLDDDSDPAISNSQQISVTPGIYVITEGDYSGWGLYSIVISDPTGDSTSDKALRKALLHITSGETAMVTFTNSKCPIANAGDDQMICSGETALLVGSYQYTTSDQVSWTVKPNPGGGYYGTPGNLIWPYLGDRSKASYTPPLAGESEAILTFTASGSCQSSVSDDVMIAIVEQPAAIIRAVSPST